MRERVYEQIASVQSQGAAGDASLTALTQGYEQVLVSVTAEVAAATLQTVAPNPSASSYTRNTGAALALPAAGEEHHYGLGAGMDIGAPVPDALFVRLVVPGGRAVIKVAGVRFREGIDARGSTMADMRDRVDRILSKLTSLVDLLSRGKR